MPWVCDTQHRCASVLLPWVRLRVASILPHVLLPPVLVGSATCYDVYHARKCRAWLLSTSHPGWSCPGVSPHQPHTQGP